MFEQGKWSETSINFLYGELNSAPRVGWHVDRALRGQKREPLNA